MTMKSKAFLKSFAKSGEMPPVQPETQTPPVPPVPVPPLPAAATNIEPSARPEPTWQKPGPKPINPKFETQHTSIRIHKTLYADILNEKTQRVIAGNKTTADIIINEALAARYGKNFQEMTEQ